MIRKAKQEDIEQIVAVMNDAKKYMAEHNIPQWTGEYPNEKDVEEDIHNDGAFVVTDEDKVVGYCFIAVKNDPCYSVIEGKWLNDEPYAVLHRTCVLSSYKGQGKANEFVSYASHLVNNLRADTHEVNTSMRRMLEKAGFVNCGTIYVADGTPRVAYQKIVNK